MGSLVLENIKKSFGPADVIKGACAISGIFELAPIRLCHEQATLEGVSYAPIVFTSVSRV